MDHVAENSGGGSARRFRETRVRQRRTQQGNNGRSADSSITRNCTYSLYPERHITKRTLFPADSDPLGIPGSSFDPLMGMGGDPTRAHAWKPPLVGEDMGATPGMVDVVFKLVDGSRGRLKARHVHLTRPYSISSCSSPACSVRSLRPASSPLHVFRHCPTWSRLALAPKGTKYGCFLQRGDAFVGGDERLWKVLRLFGAADSESAEDERKYLRQKACALFFDILGPMHLPTGVSALAFLSPATR